MDDKSWKIIPPLEDAPKISVRTAQGKTADVYSTEQMKGNSAQGKLRKLKEEGVIKDESLVKGEVGDAGVIFVITKKGAK